MNRPARTSSRIATAQITRQLSSASDTASKDADGGAFASAAAAIAAINDANPFNGAEKMTPRVFQYSSGEQDTIPEWMTIDAAEEYEVDVLPLPRLDGEEINATETHETKPSRHSKYSKHSKNSNHSKQFKQSKQTSNNDKLIVKNKSQELQTSSYLSEEKERASQSVIHPLPLDELQNYERHISNVARHLVWGEIDRCAVEALRYSSNLCTGGKARHSTVISSGVSARDIHLNNLYNGDVSKTDKVGDARKPESLGGNENFRSNSRKFQPKFTTLVEEIQSFFDQFEPPTVSAIVTDGDDNDGTQSTDSGAVENKECGAPLNVDNATRTQFSSSPVEDLESSTMEGEVEVSASVTQTAAGKAMTDDDDLSTPEMDSAKIEVRDVNLEAAGSMDTHTITKATEEVSASHDKAEVPSAHVEMSVNPSKELIEPTQSKATSVQSNPPTKNDQFTLFSELMETFRQRYYDPSIFPIAVINCHFNVLDRATMVKGLALDLGKRKRASQSPSHGQTGIEGGSRQMQNAKPGTEGKQRASGGRKKSACVCVLRSSMELVGQGELMAEILHQCMKNDPDGESFAAQLELKRKRQRLKHHQSRGILFKSVWSWSDSLVEWAGSTRSFNSIVVLIEDPENVPSPGLEHFFTALTALRSDYFVPINLIIMNATPGGLGDRLSELRYPGFQNSGWRGGGVMIKELSVPEPEEQFKIFVQEFFSGEAVPAFLWNNHQFFDHIRVNLLEFDDSITSFTKKMKAMLSECFKQPGAFMSLLASGNLVIPNWSRLALICSSYNNLQFTSSSWLFHTPRNEDSHMLHYLSHLFLRIQTSLLHRVFARRVNCMFEMDPTVALQQQLTLRQFESQLKPCIQGLIRLFDWVMHKLGISLTQVAPSVQRLTLMHHENLCEFIILAGQLLSTDINIAKHMTKMTIEKVLEWMQCHFPWHGIQHSDFSSPSVQPRRDVAMSLISSHEENIHARSFLQCSRLALCLLQSKVVTMNNWYADYFDIVTSEKEPLAELCSNEDAFFFSLLELQHCGFVRKLPKTNTRKCSYEKEAMVWVSGR